MPSLAELGEVQKALSAKGLGRLIPKKAKPVPGKPPAAPAGSGIPDWLKEPKSFGGKVDANAASRSAKQVGTPVGGGYNDAPKNLTRSSPAQMNAAAHARKTQYGPRPNSRNDWSDW